LQVMLVVHTDVVYAESEIDNDSLSIRWEGLWLHAPGAADAKGGIAVIRETLLALEASPWAEKIGWRVILNPDEEIGSPGSSELLRREAAECDFALLFEPSLPDGALVGQRKGSGNFVLHMAGRAAHAGRNPEAGRNAIHALAEVVTALASLAKPEAGLTVNVGSIAGGGSVNRVPDSATAQVNIRVTQVEQQSEVLRYLDELKAKWGKREGFALQWRGGFTAPPKLMADGTETVMRQVLSCAQALGMDLVVRPSGGVCDGNRLAAAGLPNVDTLGPRGEGLHGAGEKLFLPSLVERARLATLVLLTAASGNWRPPRRNG
jgi:glutamate carboxypeptidase